MAKLSGLLTGVAVGATLLFAAGGASAATFLLLDTGLGPTHTDILNTTGELTGGNSAVSASSGGTAFVDTAVFRITPGELLTSYSVTNHATSIIGQISGGTAEIFNAVGNTAIAGSQITIDTVPGGAVTAFTDFSSPFALGPGNYYIQITSSGFDAVKSQGAAKYSVELQGTAVPEPATWAAMLLGFGAIGASMRLRRRVTA